ncbi:MAG TPA: ACT domain-containing protein [Verrucomicrobiae bacterium]|jgi:hypothetical protein|nr:ACT domain-containing protein [Verrucomicrobiae bacterium]
MTAFLVDLENKPGAIAAIAEALGSRGVNITGISGATCGDSGRAVLTTADDVTTRTVLQDLKTTFKEYELTEASLAHTPGSLGKVARRLADAGVNIEAMMPTGMSGNEVNVGFVTDNPIKAREILATASANR